MLLPDQLTLPLLWGGLLFNLAGGFVPLADGVVGAMAGYLVLWSLYWAFKLLTGKEGMGYGDFKLLAALGAWLGWQALPWILLHHAAAWFQSGIDGGAASWLQALRARALREQLRARRVRAVCSDFMRQLHV